jgi:hypothetical protein
MREAQQASDVQCSICQRTLRRCESYILRMELFADPGVPEITSEDMPDTEQTISELLEEMESMSSDELQDKVHRHFDFRLCGVCHAQLLANPLGLPRRRARSEN